MVISSIGVENEPNDIVGFDMNVKEVENKLDIAFTKNLGVNINSGFKDDISGFREKLILLSNTGRYNKLVKSLLSSKDRKEFNSYVFEVLFAHDFESKGNLLNYEVKQIQAWTTSIDFLYAAKNGTKIYFELRQINQRKELTDLIESQLKRKGMYEVIQNGQDEQDEIVRLQNLILSKCQDKNVTPIKFGDTIQDVNVYNIIVVYVSDLFLEMIDEHDCMLSMYGDPAVPIYAQRKILGLCQHLSDDAPDWVKPYYEKFKYFREIIHGILFVKNPSRLKRCYGDLILDLDLEYYLVGNNNLVDKDNFREICSELHEILNSWTKKKEH